MPAGSRCRVLLANHALSGLSGSELATTEVARSLVALGHDVAVFAMERGPLARSFRRETGIEVFGPTDTTRLVQFAPDVVHSHHLSCALYLRELIPNTRRVHEMLGVLPAMEAPPSSAEGFDLGIVLSEEIEDAVRRTTFANTVPLRLLRNWFDDRTLVPVAPRKPRRPPSAIVVSNYLSPRLRRSLVELQQTRELTVRFVGGPLDSHPVTAQLLSGFDVVVSLGRTAILAAASGVPCIVADRDLSDGLLTPANLEHLRRANFSGRTLRKQPTVEHLREQLNGIATLDQMHLADLVRSEYGLSARASQLSAIYAELMLQPTQTGIFPPAEGHAFAEMAGTIGALRRRLDAVKSAIPAGPIVRKLAAFRHRLRAHGLLK